MCLNKTELFTLPILKLMNLFSPLEALKVLTRGILLWILFMLVITATWYLAAKLAIFPDIGLSEPLSSEHRDDFFLLASITIVFSIWIASLNYRWSSLHQKNTALHSTVRELEDKSILLNLKYDNRYQQMPASSVMLDKDLIIRDCNNTFASLVMIDCEFLIGKSLSTLVHEHNYQHWLDNALGLFDETAQKPLQLELKRVTDGREQSVWVKINSRIIKTDDAVQTTHLIMTDISDQIYAENYLRDAYQLLEQQIINRTSDLYEMNERMAMAATSAEMGIWDIELETGKLIWDEWMYRLHGLTKSNFDNTLDSWKKAIFEADRQKVDDIWKATLVNHKPFDLEFRIVQPNGNIHWIKANALFKNDKQGTAIRVIGICRDITIQKENEKLIQQQADYDDLTGLPNRKLFNELLRQEIKEGKRDHYQIWLLFLDLDGFKEVNDTLGHHLGDLLLQKVAERLQSHLRNADIVARLGGDEFVIILTDIDDISDVNHIAESIIGSLGKVYRINSEEVFVTASVGIANFPNDADNTTDLLKFADQAMYVSKQEGKDTYSYFTPALQSASLLRKEISQDLRQGIAKDHFQIYYQPIIDLQSGNIYKAEALIRWEHPIKGLISPADFIPIAEETGIIKELGFWIFENAFKQLKQWSDMLPENFQLSINMSPVQLKSSDDIIDSWFDLLQKYSLEGKNIVIEITEGLLLKNDHIVNERLLRYGSAGVQVAIDDFGTGYSSLAYLKEFDIDYLKIDQSFTQKISSGSNEKALSHAIVLMAQQLGLRVIAEGIETPEQRDFLKSMGCDFGQGYLFSKPLPADEFETLMLQETKDLQQSINRL